MLKTSCCDISMGWTSEGESNHFGWRERWIWVVNGAVLHVCSVCMYACVTAALFSSWCLYIVHIPYFLPLSSLPPFPVSYHSSFPSPLPCVVSFILPSPHPCVVSFILPSPPFRVGYCLPSHHLSHWHCATMWHICGYHSKDWDHHNNQGSAPGGSERVGSRSVWWRR